MIKLRDHYFISWLKVVKNINVHIHENVIYVDMSPKEYTEYLEEYNNTLKPLLKEIRKSVKELASLTK